MARSTFPRQNVKNARGSDHFWKLRCRKSARRCGAFGSQHLKNTRGSDHFWRFSCRKSARRCGAKHILKSTCYKHQGFGPLLEVQMSKKCMPVWREATSPIGFLLLKLPPRPCAVLLVYYVRKYTKLYFYTNKSIILTPCGYWMGKNLVDHGGTMWNH